MDEHNGFLALSDEEYQTANLTNPNIRPYAWEFLEYGERKEGYWTWDKVIAQMHRVIEIAKINTLEREDGIMFGCLITAAAMLLWQIMLLMSMPWTWNQEGSSGSWRTLIGMASTVHVHYSTEWNQSCKRNEISVGGMWSVNRNWLDAWNIRQTFWLQKWKQHDWTLLNSLGSVIEYLRACSGP